jgi:hypothetical protein
MDWATRVNEVRANYPHVGNATMTATSEAIRYS